MVCLNWLIFSQVCVEAGYRTSCEFHWGQETPLVTVVTTDCKVWVVVDTSWVEFDDPIFDDLGYPIVMPSGDSPEGVILSFDLVIV